MSIKRIIPVLICLSLFSFNSYAGEEPAVGGVYTRLPDHQYQFDGRQVEIVEFMSFYCGHCYQFEKDIPVIKGNFPRKIKWKTVPVYWGKGSPKPGEAYLLAEEAGKGEQMKKALFEAFFVDKKDIGTIEVIEDIAVKIGLGFDFSSRLRSGDKAKETGDAMLKAKAYDINETPTLIIAGNIKAEPGKFSAPEGFRDNVITILKGIFKNK
ncbi:MAG: DsbA family protein [Nitrospirota bacterium]|nr:DsbA family protein [Nitrospirota bacterium]